MSRRIILPQGEDPYKALYGRLTEPGDYCGPFVGASGKPEVWYLLPITEDVPGHPEARSLHHVESPPHTFTEEKDGTLTISASIGAGPSNNYYWHGYLEKGIWRKA